MVWLSYEITNTPAGGTTTRVRAGQPWLAIVSMSIQDNFKVPYNLLHKLLLGQGGGHSFLNRFTTKMNMQTLKLHWDRSWVSF